MEVQLHYMDVNSQSRGTGRLTPGIQMNRRLGGANRRSGRFGGKKSHAPTRNQTLDRPVHSRYYTDWATSIRIGNH